MSLLFNKVVIVGVGLMGASLGMDLLRTKKVKTILGVGRKRANLNVAKRKKAITHIFSGKNLDNAWAGADLIILATPVAVIPHFMKSIAGAKKKGLLKDRVIVMDVGSTKGTIVQAARRHLAPNKITFLGAHPIAGTENSRAQAAFSGLYKGKVCILTPEKKTPRWALHKVGRLWRSVGSKIVTMTASRHDALLAHCSHLPHVVAYSLMHTLLVNPQALAMSGGGFRDFTRIASSDPEMWRDICLENQKAILEAMTHFEKKMSSFKRSIRKRDGRALYRLFEKAREVRRTL